MLNIQPTPCCKPHRYIPPSRIVAKSSNEAQGKEHKELANKPQEEAVKVKTTYYKQLIPSKLWYTDKNLNLSEKQFEIIGSAIKDIVKFKELAGLFKRKNSPYKDYAEIFSKEKGEKLGFISNTAFEKMPKTISGLITAVIKDPEYLHQLQKEMNKVSENADIYLLEEFSKKYGEKEGFERLYKIDKSIVETCEDVLNRGISPGIKDYKQEIERRNKNYNYL